MPSTAITFTSISGGMTATGTLVNGLTSVDITAEHYQLVQMSSTQLWLKPLNGAYDLQPFAYADVVSPAPGNLAALKVALRNMLPSNSNSSMIPNGTIYVSDGLGNDGFGTGAIDAPLKTINAGITLAESNSVTYPSLWTVAVLPGNYDEQIAPTGANIVIEFFPGASLLYSGAGASVDSTGQLVQIVMHLGSTLTHTNAGDVISCPANGVAVTGTGILLTDSAGRLADVGAGVLVLNDMALQGNGNTAELVNIAAGAVVKMTRCTFTQPDTNAAIVVNGAPTVNLDSCRFQCSGTEYVSSTGAESIQVVECVSNKAKGAGITETVGTTLVDAAYTI